MKLRQIALVGSFLILLAGCGNDSPINPPTTTGGTTSGTTSGGTTGTTTIGTTTGTPTTTGGTTTGGTTGATTGITTGGFPFPTTTGGTTGSTTGSTTGTTTGTTTGGTTGTIEGTLTLPLGGTVTGAAAVYACYPTGNNAAPCDANLSVIAEAQFFGESSDYVVTGLQSGQYLVLALADADGNGEFDDAADYVGFFRSLSEPELVTPPATGVDMQMVTVDDAGLRALRTFGAVRKLLR